jgi:HD superfamily phosphohydrolase
MDADKLDYLRRDSFHAGVFFSNGIDLERFFESLRACVNTDVDSSDVMPAIGVSEKGVAPAETIITARYHLYSIVYWHRTVRCITAILQRAISEVRLAVGDEKWLQFAAALIDQFRRLDDRSALRWLKANLEERGLLERTAVSPTAAGSPAQTVTTTTTTTIGSLIDALLEGRNDHFRMAFELGYSGPSNPGSKSVMTAREILHDRICGAVHPTQKLQAASDGAAKIDAVKKGRLAREELSTLRQDLEGRFVKRVAEYTNKVFVLDTILLDVLEPGKDQMQGLLVDTRSKRSRRGSSISLQLSKEARPEFVDLISVSPIAASLSNVFARWARKVRIFMTPGDLKKLKDLHLEAGDVSNIWEEVLYEKFGIALSQLNQLNIRFEQ